MRSGDGCGNNNGGGGGDGATAGRKRIAQSPPLPPRALPRHDGGEWAHRMRRTA
jgi:hypothetical protein